MSKEGSLDAPTRHPIDFEHPDFFNPEKLDAEVADMVGEVTNMICGNAKRDLAERGFEFGMATPIVVSGHQHSISHQVDGAKIILPFMCDEGLAHLEICFDK